MVQQAGLPFPSNAQQTFEGFITGANAELIDYLRRSGDKPGLIWIWGPQDSGRTHLLHALCGAADTVGAHAGYLPLSLLPVDGLDGYESYRLLALDDLDSWLTRLDHEQGLLAVYEAVRSKGGSLVVCACASPLDTSFALPDLASRMRSANVFHLLPLDDEGKTQLLIERARERGLELSRDVAAYWLLRGSRGIAELLTGLERLDKASLAQGRKLTVPFVKAVLGL